MINLNINELSVWTDSLEDSNVDVSLVRLLSIYHYLSLNLSYGYDYGNVYEYSNGYGYSNGYEYSNGYGYGNGYD